MPISTATRADLSLLTGLITPCSASHKVGADPGHTPEGLHSLGELSTASAERILLVSLESFVCRVVSPELLFYLPPLRRLHSDQTGGSKLSTLSFVFFFFDFFFLKLVWGMHYRANNLRNLTVFALIIDNEEIMF